MSDTQASKQLDNTHKPKSKNSKNKLAVQSNTNTQNVTNTTTNSDATKPTTDSKVQMLKAKRYFKLMYGGDHYGRFSGSKPKQAALKALTAITKSIYQFKAGSKTDQSPVHKELLKIDPQKLTDIIAGKEFVFSIKECTRGRKHKEYYYIGFRQKLDTPIKVIIGKGKVEKVIEYKYNNKVKKCSKMPDLFHNISESDDQSSAQATAASTTTKTESKRTNKRKSNKPSAAVTDSKPKPKPKPKSKPAKPKPAGKSSSSNAPKLDTPVVKPTSKRTKLNPAQVEPITVTATAATAATATTVKTSKTSKKKTDNKSI
jgi:hypothetical protein